MPRLLFATSNAHKRKEVADMLGADWEVEDLRDHPNVIMPEETGTTFDENAILKGVTASKLAPDLMVLADDSGLEVYALGGAPGVISARYAGEGASDADNREKLKAELSALGPADATYRGRFCCSMVLVLNGQILHLATGTVEGKLVLQEQGEGGFGYDPLFIPEGYDKTLGVLPSETKNQLSHRARAVASLKEWLLLHSNV